MFAIVNRVNEVQQMTMKIDVALLSGKKNQKLVSKLLAKGFQLQVVR